MSPAQAPSPTGDTVNPADFWYSSGGHHNRTDWYRVRELYACGNAGRLGEPGMAVSSMWMGARKADIFTEKNIVASDAFGGLVAVVRNDKVLQEVDSTSRPVIRVYTAAGSLLSCIPIPTKDVLALQWANYSPIDAPSSASGSSTVLAVVSSDLTVALLSTTTTASHSDTSSCVIHRYTLPQDKLLREEGGVEMVRTWSDGMVMVTAAGRVHACIGWRTGLNFITLGNGPLPEGTRPVCLLPLEPPCRDSNDVRCLVSVEEVTDNSAAAIGVGFSSGRVLLLDKNGRQEEILTGALTVPTSSGAEQDGNVDFRRPLGVVISMAKSFSGHMVGLLSDSGRFRLLPTSPDLNPEYHQPPPPPESVQPTAHTGSLVITPGDVAAAQRRKPAAPSPTAENSDPFCPPLPSSVADAASPMSTFTRVTVSWCGDDAIAIYVTDSRREKYSIFLGGTAPAFTADSSDYWVDPPFEFGHGVHLQSEADGLRVIDLDQTVLIQRVGPATEAVFGFGGSKSPPATLSYAYERYAKSGDVRAELSVRALRGGKASTADLQRAVIGCIEAAVAETPPVTREARQRIEQLMRAAQFGRRFLQATPTAGGMAAISKAVVLAAAYVRVSSALAQAPIYMPASVAQLKLMSPRAVVSKVAERPGQQLLAFRIAEWLGCDPSSAVECWADALLASPSSTRMTDREILTAIMDKLKCLPHQSLAASSGVSSNDPLKSSPTTLATMARLCVHYNRQAVASQLLLSLDHRGQQQQQSEGPSGEVVPAASEQTVGLLLSLGSVPLALRKAVEVGSPDSIQRCIASIIGSSVDMEDTANDIVQACKEADLTPPENVLVAALVLDRWREEQDRRSGVLRNDDSIKIILRDLVGSSAVAQHSAAVALRTAIAAPVAEASKEDASGGGGRWWSRLGRSDRTSDQSRVLTRSDAADMFRNVGGEFSAVYGTTREASAQQSAVILQEESDLCRRQAQLERLSAMRGWTGAAGNKFVGLSMWETVRRLVTIGEVEEARGLLTKAKLLPEYNRRWWKVAVDALVNARRFSELAQMAEAAARSAGPPIGFEPIVALLLENQQFDLARGLVGKCKDMEQVASFYETLGMREEAMKAQQLAEQQRRSAIGGTSLLTGWSSTIAGAMRGGFTRS